MLMALAMAFTTVLLVANIIAGKIITLGGWEMSAGIIAYPLTFLITDTIAEVYGRKATTRVVWFGFGCSLLMIGMIYLGGRLPASEEWAFQQSYLDIFENTPRIVAASMIAYLVAQNHDVFAFHFWRRKTNGRHLWLRNNASTAVSQLMDTALFTGIAFGGVYGIEIVVGIFVAEYIIKIAASVIDTPLVYGLVGLVRRIDGKRAGLADADPAAPAPESAA